MFKVLFIVGPPGSGKSEAYRNICTHVEELRIERINDYAILMRMCDEDSEHKHFRPTQEYRGFIVIHYPAFNDALREANQKILNYAKKHMRSSRHIDHLLVVEFSRNDYYLAFQQFDKDILLGALFLLITTDREECHERLEKRIEEPLTEDNHYVPPEILHDYYDIALPYTSQDLREDFKVPREQIEEINNNGTLEEFRERIRRFIDDKIIHKAHR